MWYYLLMDDPVQEFENLTPPEVNKYNEEPLPENIAREEAKHLYGMMEELDKNLRASREYHNNELSINPQVIRPESGIAKISALNTSRHKTTPFSGIGTGHVEFNSNNRTLKGIFGPADKLGIETRYILSVCLHMDSQTLDSAKEIFDKGLVPFVTRFLFTKDGNYQVISMFPPSIKTQAEIVSQNDTYKFVKTPFTAHKAEIAGMAINYLLQKVKDVNTAEIQDTEE